MADTLNPPGIRVAGIKMLPVMGGRYKVWTKRMGSGPIKVLLLHGGPGFTHQYLSLLPRGEFLLCPDGSHCAMWDDQEVYFAGLLKFLKSSRETLIE